VLPYARSVTTGTPATAFATIINAGASTATACSLAQPPGFPGTFHYQTTDVNNALTGTPDTPVSIAAGAAQTFVFGVTPGQDLNEVELAVVFDCSNTPVTVSIPGVNTLLLSAAAFATPDLIAIGATPSNDGIVNIPGNTGIGLCTAAAINIGAAGTITAAADDGGKALSLTLLICQTSLTTGACINPTVPAASTTATIATNETVTYTIFVTGTGNIAFDPANNRLFLRLKSADQITRGATNVAVRTQ
jgi:hypothetical protein